MPGGVQKVCRHGTSGYGLVGMVVLGWQLDSVILEVFSDLNDSMIKTCCSSLSGYPFWILLKEHQTAENRVVSAEVRYIYKKQHRQFTYFVLFFLALFFIIIFHFCHSFLYRSFAFLHTKACSFQSYEQFKQIFLVKGKLQCCWWLELNTSSLGPCRTPLHTPWLAHKLPHLTSLVHIGGAANTRVLNVV